jgi:hypothetical protein
MLPPCLSTLTQCTPHHSVELDDLEELAPLVGGDDVEVFHRGLDRFMREDLWHRPTLAGSESPTDAQKLYLSFNPISVKVLPGEFPA